MLCADWDSLVFVKLLLLPAFVVGYLSKLFSFVVSKLLLLSASEGTISFVFRDVLSLSFLINLAEINGGVFFTTFCSQTTTDEDVTVDDDAVVRGADTSVALVKHVFDGAEVITDDNVSPVVDTDDCKVAFVVVGFDDKL